jgi:hypothetical protein
MRLTGFNDTEPLSVQLRRLADRVEHDPHFHDAIVIESNRDTHYYERAAGWLRREAEDTERYENDTGDPFAGLPQA